MSDDSIRFECLCGQPMRAPRAVIGRKASCRKCGRPVIVPQVSTRPAPAPTKQEPLQPVEFSSVEPPPVPPALPKPAQLRVPPPLSPAAASPSPPAPEPTPAPPPRLTQWQKTVRILKRSAMRNVPAVLCLLCLLLFLGYRLITALQAPTESQAAANAGAPDVASPLDQLSFQQKADLAALSFAIRFVEKTLLAPSLSSCHLV